MESVKSLFGGKSKDFITAVDEKSIIVVKELEDGENYPEMDQLAHTILDTLGMGNDGKTKKSSAANPRMTLTKRLWSQLISSSRTASMFQRHPDSFTSIETLWSIASINSRRVQVLISVFLKMPLHSRLHSW